MDLVMGLSRDFEESPESVIKILIGGYKYEEAKRAINEYNKGCKTTTKEKGKTW